MNNEQREFWKELLRKAELHFDGERLWPLALNKDRETYLRVEITFSSMSAIGYNALWISRDGKISFVTENKAKTIANVENIDKDTFDRLKRLLDDSFALKVRFVEADEDMSSKQNWWNDLRRMLEETNRVRETIDVSHRY
jgi:hypothetical protein